MTPGIGGTVMIKKLCCILCCIAILCLTATTGFAEGWYWYDDAPQTGTITFDFNTDGISVSGGSVDMRMVAIHDPETKSLQFCEGWENCGLDLNEFLDETAAQRLLAYAEANELAAHEIKIGSDGRAKVTELPMGVYLVSQSIPFDGYTCMVPALISVPLMGDDHNWMFDIQAQPKLEPLVPETTVPNTETPPPELPPTGQVNWPVPLMLLSGCFLILLGICLRRDKRHETNV